MSEPAGISCRTFVKSAIVCAPSTTRPSRRRSTDPEQGSSVRPAVRPPRRRADVDAGGSAAALARPRTICCTWTRPRITASPMRSPDRWVRTAGDVSGGHGVRMIRHRTAVNCCAAGVVTTPYVPRCWNAAAAGFTGAVRSSAASVSESLTSTCASRLHLTSPHLTQRPTSRQLERSSVATNSDASCRSGSVISTVYNRLTEILR